MEPTILKNPRIYKGAGIYKNGAEGGGGSGGGTQYCSIYFSQEMSLDLPQTLEKANLSIIFSFVKIYNSTIMLQLYGGGNSKGYVRIGSNGSLIVNNEASVYGSEYAINSSNQSLIIREGSYRRIEEFSISNYWCPYQNANIDKISFKGTIRRIAFYTGAINDFGQDNKIIDLRPDVDNGQNGFRDIVNGDFYPLSNSTVSP